MAKLTGADQARYVQAMFSRIASRYDLMNRLMTAGQDTRWRREVINRTQLPPDGRILDLGAGTGDLAREAERQEPTSWVVAADFTLNMMRVGRAQYTSTNLNWLAADALCLPVPNESFEAAVSGFLLRNVIDIDQCLREQYRVLKPGGYMVALDTTRPPKNFLRPLINFYLHIIIPNLGRIITGETDAYTYLPETTESFLEAEQLAAYMKEVGYHQVGFHRLMFGTIAIHWGRK
jgi:demethylmenaquinone methyltransferase/2-methoxy-6-polyprenyl-1,4-benzoquinol methylase